MPKITSLYEQHRQSIGRHINWLDKIQSHQEPLSTVLKKIAIRPGLHSGNVHRRNIAQAMIGLLSILSSVQFSGANLAKQEKENNESTIDYFIDKKEGYSTFRMNNKNSSVSYPISSYEVGSPRTLNSSSHIVKRSLYRLNDIPLEILTLTQSSRYNYKLRNTLDTIFRLSRNSLEYKDAEGGLKDLFLLMKCVQIMKVFVIKTESMNLDVFSKGKYMLESLINIGEALKMPYHKNIFKKFKSNLISDLSTMKIMGLPDDVIDEIHQGKQFNYELIKFSNHDMNNFFLVKNVVC
ncbi:hypothetical protein [Pectobacterium brasiliense]|uniref:hypothetical protein n=1 Tax=Pectobacterium brasiliense TaxID=180957 RepID=UPI00196933B8|nr:hypothetical protein [Pectobacterium brasiliense]MBN3264546.1 hypothetical protein [Pectobacterium brasiliense]